MTQPRPELPLKKFLSVWTYLGLCSHFSSFFAETRIPYGGETRPWRQGKCKGRYAFHLQIAATFQPKPSVSSPLFCTESVAEEAQGSFQNTSAGWQSQTSVPLLQSLRGELPIAEKFGPYKQIKSGNCSAVTQPFHSLICTVILHYPLIVTYTFLSPNTQDKHWIRLKSQRSLAGWLGEKSVFSGFLLPSTGPTALSDPFSPETSL